MYDLLNYWKGSCAITSMDIPEILRASDIKAWADCDNDSDRFNIYNGFLLSTNYDALFDKGLITFDDKGSIIYSNRLSEGQIHDIVAKNIKFYAGSMNGTCLFWNGTGNMLL